MPRRERLGDRITHLVGGSHGHGGLVDDYGEAGRHVLGDGSGGLGQKLEVWSTGGGWGCADCDEDDFGTWDGFRVTGGEGEVGPRFFEQFLQKGLIDGNFARL